MANSLATAMFKAGLEDMAKKKGRKPKPRPIKYPYGQEREYRKYIIDIMTQFSAIATPFIRNNLQSWIGEYKNDSLRLDDYADDISVLNNRLRARQQQIFDETDQVQQDLFVITG